MSRQAVERHVLSKGSCNGNILKTTVESRAPTLEFAGHLGHSTAKSRVGHHRTANIEIRETVSDCHSVDRSVGDLDREEELPLPSARRTSSVPISGEEWLIRLVKR